MAEASAGSGVALTDHDEDATDRGGLWIVGSLYHPGTHMFAGVDDGVGESIVRSGTAAQIPDAYDSLADETRNITHDR